MLFEFREWRWQCGLDYCVRFEAELQLSWTLKQDGSDKTKINTIHREKKVNK